MIGHCGGLRPSQRIGDYVLAHAYLRDDHILDAVLPVAIPIPPIAEEGWRENQDALKASYGNCQGWAQMLCALKAWLEHGINLREGMYV